MKRIFTTGIAVLGAVLTIAGTAHAQAITLPNTSQTTTLTATVSEQALVTVPAAVSFS